VIGSGRRRGDGSQHFRRGNRADGGPLVYLTACNRLAVRDRNLGETMSDSARERNVREPKLLLPFLRSFYDVVVPLAWPMARFACGFHLIIHGWGKIIRGGTVANSTLAFGIFLTVIEFVGGICITLGLFTRFFAAAVSIEMAYLTFVQYWNNGYGWRTEGYEYVLMWGMLAFAIALRGGGNYSLDRAIGREL
jgi:putative oxidoreductase